MKLKIIIDKEKEEEILIFCHERTYLIDEIERLFKSNESGLVGYSQGGARKISPSEISCFMVENNKVYALAGKEKLQIKMRLYQLEERLDSSFVKINQSCKMTVILQFIAGIQIPLINTPR